MGAITEADPIASGAVVDASTAVETGTATTEVVRQLASVAGARAAAATPEPGDGVVAEGVVEARILRARRIDAPVAVPAGVAGGAQAGGAGATRLETGTAVRARVALTEVNALFTSLTYEPNRTGTTVTYNERTRTR